MHAKTLIVLTGPTASGKTTLAIHLATHFHTEIINADSRQFYIGLNIGTAKPTPEEQKTVPHHFIDFLSPEENYNIGKYEINALDTLKKLFQNHDVVILTGGSGLYIQAVCEGIDEVPESDPALRTKLNSEFHEKGIEFLQEKLKLLDPEYFQQVDQLNPHRLIRALEVCMQTGNTFSALRKQSRKSRDFNILKIGLLLEREELYSRINYRVEDMIKKGLIEEAKTFFHLRHLNALQTVGYRELFDYFDDKLSLENAITLIKQNTRNYAKRQMTWFRKDKEIHWFDPEEKENIISFISGFLE